MKKVFFILIAFILGLLVNSCEESEPTVQPLPSPIANFNYTGDDHQAPCLVTFTNSSENGTVYNWDFGDGISTTETSPSHVFTSGGVYSVKLITKNAEGKEDIITKSVNIPNAPTKLIINSIVLNSYPMTNPNGGGWDNNTAADLFFQVTDSLASVVYFESGMFEDAVATELPIGFPMEIEISDLYYTVAIMLYDYDSLSANEFIGGFYLNASWIFPTNGEAYPEEVLVNFPNGINAVMHIVWE